MRGRPGQVGLGVERLPGAGLVESRRQGADRVGAFGHPVAACRAPRPPLRDGAGPTGHRRLRHGSGRPRRLATELRRVPGPSRTVEPPGGEAACLTATCWRSRCGRSADGLARLRSASAEARAELTPAERSELNGQRQRELEARANELSAPKARPASAAPRHCWASAGAAGRRTGDDDHRPDPREGQRRHPRNRGGAHRLDADDNAWGGAAWSARPTWPKAPTSITFFIEGAALMCVSTQGGRAKFAVATEEWFWHSVLYPLGKPELN